MMRSEVMFKAGGHTDSVMFSLSFLTLVFNVLLFYRPLIVFQGGVLTHYGAIHPHIALRGFRHHAARQFTLGQQLF